MRLPSRVAAFFIGCGPALFLLCPDSQAKDIEWKPRFVAGNDIFPSYILALAAIPCPPAFETKHPDGDCHTPLGLEFTSPEDNANVKVAISIGGLAKDYEGEATMGKAGTKFNFYPKIPWDYEALTKLSQPTTTNITIKITINGNPAGQKTLRTRFRSVNDALLAISMKKNVVDLRFLVATYVNENNPIIDQILREALSVPVKTVKEWTGYQVGGPQRVQEQVFALWYYFQRRGVTYSSITTSSGSSDGGRPRAG